MYHSNTSLSTYQKWNLNFDWLFSNCLHLRPTVIQCTKYILCVIFLLCDIDFRTTPTWIFELDFDISHGSRCVVFLYNWHNPNLQSQIFLVRVNIPCIQSLQWRYNEHNGVSDHQPHECFYSTVYSGSDLRKHQSTASLAFVRGTQRWPVNSPHKGLVTCKMFQLMTSSRCMQTLLCVGHHYIATIYSHCAKYFIYKTACR